jgi:hypothetical protein
MREGAQQKNDRFINLEWQLWVDSRRPRPEGAADRTNGRPTAPTCSFNFLTVPAMSCRLRYRLEAVVAAAHCGSDRQFGLEMLVLHLRLRWQRGPNHGFEFVERLVRVVWIPCDD